MRKLFTNSNHICLSSTADLNVIANVNSNVEKYPMNFRHITGCKTHYWILNTSWYLFAVLGNETNAPDRKVLVPGSGSDRLATTCNPHTTEPMMWFQTRDRDPRSAYRFPDDVVQCAGTMYNALIDPHWIIGQTTVLSCDSFRFENITVHNEPTSLFSSCQSVELRYRKLRSSDKLNWNLKYKDVR